MENLSILKKNYINYIDKIIQNGHISHAYLCEIDNYDTDLTYIYNFIKMILCNVQYNDLDGLNNNIINLIDNNNYPDIKVIEPDGNVIKKQQLLELQKEYSNTSLIGGKRIYLIKNAEKLNPASANTILKFLEEPEDNIIAFLITYNRYHVIDTILSRCQILTLKEDNFYFDVDNDILELLKCVANPKSFYSKYNYFLNNIIIDKNVAIEKFKIIENIFINYLDNLYSDENNINEEIVALLSECSNEKILNYLSIFEDEIPKLDFNVNFKLWIDSFFSKLIIGG